MTFLARRFRLRLATLLVFAPFACAAQTPPPRPDAASLDQALSLSALREDLRLLHVSVELTARAAAELARERTETRAQRSAVDQWAAFVERRTRALTKETDPATELIDFWAMSERLASLARQPETAELFGPAAPVILQANARVRDDVLLVATTYLTDEARATAAQGIREFVAANPLRLDRASPSNLFNLSEGFFSVLDVGKGIVGTVTSIPFLPQRTAQGLGRGADELQRFSMATESFARTLEALPAETRVEIESLMTRFDDSHSSIAMTVADLRIAAGSIERAVADADKLTSGSREVVVAAGETADSIRAAADSIEGAAVASRGLVESIAILLERLERDRTEPGGKGFDPAEYAAAAEAIGGGADQVRAMLEEIRRLTQGDERTPSGGERAEGRTFDVREYDRAAQSIREAAAEINASLDRLTALGGNAEGGEIDALNVALESAEARAFQIVDRTIRGLGQLLLLGFALMALVFWLRPRLEGGRRAGRPGTNGAD